MPDAQRKAGRLCLLRSGNHVKLRGCMQRPACAKPCAADEQMGEQGIGKSASGSASRCDAEGQGQGPARGSELGRSLSTCCADVLPYVVAARETHRHARLSCYVLAADVHRAYWRRRHACAAHACCAVAAAESQACQGLPVSRVD